MFGVLLAWVLFCVYLWLVVCCYLNAYDVCGLTSWFVVWRLFVYGRFMLWLFVCFCLPDYLVLPLFGCLACVLV